MASKILALISLVALPWSVLGQKTADGYFHNGVQSYVFGEKEKAKTEVQEGLQKFPSDQKLNELAGLLQKEEEQQQQQQQQNDQKQDKQDQDQKNDQKQQDQQNQQEQDQKQQDQAKQDQQKKEQEEKQKQQQEQQQQAQQQKDKEEKEKEKAAQSAQNGKKDEEKEAEQGEAQPAGVVRMTPQQAQQFLEALKQQDQTLIFAPPKKPQKANVPLKDW